MDVVLGYVIAALVFLWLRGDEKRFEVFMAIVALSFFGLIIGALVIGSVYAGIMCLLGGKIMSGLVLIAIGLAVSRWLMKFLE